MIFDKHIFVFMNQQQHKFQTTTSHIMFSKRTSTIFIPISKGQKVEISGVSYIFDCTSNLFSLLQLKETGISYYNRGDYMILKRNNREIPYIK